MTSITVTELRANIYKLLDQVLATGMPLEINKGGRRLQIVPLEPFDKFQNLLHRPEIIQGDPDDLVSIEWELTIDLP